MKKLFRAVPHLTVILAMIYLVLFTIDRFNENMKFISNDITKWGMAAFAVCAIASAVALIRRELNDDMPETGSEEPAPGDADEIVELVFDDDLPEPREAAAEVAESKDEPAEEPKEDPKEEA